MFEVDSDEFDVRPVRTKVDVGKKDGCQHQPRYVGRHVPVLDMVFAG